MDFDVNKLTPEQLAALAGKLGPSLADSIAAKVQEAIVPKVVSATTDQLKQSVAGHVEEAVKKLQPAADPKKDDGKGKGNDDEPPAWAKTLQESLKALQDERQSEKQKSEQEAARAATLRLVSETLAQKYPHINKDALPIYVEDIASRNPKTPEEVVAGLQDLAKNRYARQGIDVKSLLASPEGEGGKKTLDTPEAKKQALIDQIRSEAKGGAL